MFRPHAYGAAKVFRLSSSQRRHPARALPTVGPNVQSCRTDVTIPQPETCVRGWTHAIESAMNSQASCEKRGFVMG